MEVAEPRDASPVDSRPPSAEPGPATDAHSPPPLGLRHVTHGGHSQDVWPFTTAQFPAREQDPVNVIVVGRADPREIRAALLSLDGERPVFPAVPPFGERWKDAIGGHQAAFSRDGGWTGSVIQLECGDYQPIRVHVRIFPAGRWTLVNAHLDVIIPGTAEHEVVSWELARRLVVHDLQRSGLLEASRPTRETDVIHPRVFRRVRPDVLGGLPASLLDLLVQSGSITLDGRLLTSGTATIVELAHTAAVPAPSWSQEVHVRYRQVIPKPFCNAGGEHVGVAGEVTLRQRVEQAADGSLRSRVEGFGSLAVTPADVRTGALVGEPSRAEVVESHEAVVGDGVAYVSMEHSRTVTSGPMKGQQGAGRFQVGPAGEASSAQWERRDV